MEKRRILIDTSAYVAFLRGDSEIRRSLQQAEDINLNPVVLGELLSGFMMGRNEKKNRAILQDFLSDPTFSPIPARCLAHDFRMDSPEGLPDLPMVQARMIMSQI